MFEEEFAALKAFRELLSYSLLDDAGARKADKRARFGDIKVAEHGEAGRDAACCGVSEDADVGYARVVKLRQAGGDLGKLHEAHHALHHASPAACRDDNERAVGGEGAVDGPGDGFADDCTHAAADERILHGAHHDWVSAHVSDGGDDGVVEPGLLLSCGETLLVGLDVGEVERVSGAQAALNIGEAGFEQELNALSRTHFEVIAALGAYVDVGFEIGFEENLAAAEAFYPKPLGADALRLAVLGWLVFLIRITVCSLEPRHNDFNCKWAEWRGAWKRLQGNG